MSKTFISHHPSPLNWQKCVVPAIQREARPVMFCVMQNHHKNYVKGNHVCRVLSQPLACEFREQVILLIDSIRTLIVRINRVLVVVLKEIQHDTESNKSFCLPNGMSKSRMLL